jgi:cytochrome c oxidase subunit 2
MLSDWLPLLASEEGAEVDRLMLLTHSLMAIIFIGWLLFFIYVLIRFRKKRQPTAIYGGFRGRWPLLADIGVFTAEILLLALIAIPFWMRVVEAQPGAGPAPVEVRVIAQQYVWNCHYPGVDGQFGRVDVSLVDDQTNPVGLDRTDPAAADDIVLVNQLTLPVDQPALVWLTSKDVVHSFYVPEFRVKRDAIPGMRIPVRFTPTMTTQQFQELTGNAERTFEIACAQLCGLGHYRMRGFLTVLKPEEYRAWLVDQAPKAEGEEPYDPFWD